MSGQGRFPGFNEKPDDWGLTWNPKGEASPASGSADSLFGNEVLKDLAGKNPRDLEAKFAAAYRCYIPDSERWKVNRAPAIERATNARGEKHCERCRRQCDVLEVHHLTYERFTQELPSDLLALCPSCHETADIERRAAWQRQLARWREEEETAYEVAGFHGWLHKVKGIEPDEVGDDLAWLREEYDEWCRDREDCDPSDYQ